MFVASVCITSVVLLPAGLALVNRLPQVMTRRPRSTVVNAAPARPHLLTWLDP
jgi:hypothetical protein